MNIEKLHYISQQPEKGTHLDAIEKVLQAGGKWIQLRIKEQPESAILEIAIEAVALCTRYQATLIINDYPEIAKKAGAHGVHLGLDDMPIPEARALLGEKAIIGGTANTYAHILQRANEGADYIGLGPYRFTTTKKNLSPIIGLTGYQTIINQMLSEKLKIPLIAIGGIELKDIPLLTSLGLHGVAISAVLTRNAEQLQEIQETLTIRTDTIC